MKKTCQKKESMLKNGFNILYRKHNMNNINPIYLDESLGSFFGKASLATLPFLGLAGMDYANTTSMIRDRDSMFRDTNPIVSRQEKMPIRDVMNNISPEAFYQLGVSPSSQYRVLKNVSDEKASQLLDGLPNHMKEDIVKRSRISLPSNGRRVRKIIEKSRSAKRPI